MDKKELAYVIMLSASLFSLSLLLFSQGITSLSVSLNDEQPIAVATPTLFTMNKVIIIIVLASVGAHSLTMLTSRLGSIQRMEVTLDSENGIEDMCLVNYKEDAADKQNAEIPSEQAELPAESDGDSVDVRMLPFNKTEHKKKIAVNILQGDEKQIYMIICEKKEVLQSELVLESGLSKVKVSRLLQKLENKSLVTRKPYGNTNKVILAE